MTEENTMQEFGTHVGQVVRFFNRKGFGFIKDLHDDKDYFVHNTEISLKDNGYRKLYPGEYVSYNIIDKDSKQVCTGVRGIMGFPLLTENADHVYRVYPKNNGLSREDTPRYQSIASGSDSGSDSNSEGVTNGEEEEEEEPTKEEFINKEAPEGIEVAEFDGLNINEEMGS
jgi:cold shock CspA family protein